jgi:mannose-6-phosphate isomerase-like protein (cupin superfamily)
VTFEGRETASSPVLDLNPAAGLVFEWLPAPADPEKDAWSVINIMSAGFRTLPLHHHREAVESFTVESGVLDLWHGGKWNQVRAGETYVVPRGENHTLRNRASEPVRLVDTHEPALEFPEYILTLHALAATGRVKSFTLPRPKDIVYTAMLQQRFRREITSVVPPEWLTGPVARLGRRLGMTLPDPDLPAA